MKSGEDCLKAKNRINDEIGGVWNVEIELQKHGSRSGKLTMEKVRLCAIFSVCNKI